MLRDDSVDARRNRFIRLARVVLVLWLIFALGGALRVLWAIQQRERWIGTENVPLSVADMRGGLIIFLVMALLSAVLLTLLQRWAKRSAS